MGPIPVADGLGKEVVVTYDTGIASGREFWTDSNGLAMIRRVRCGTDPGSGGVEHAWSENSAPWSGFGLRPVFHSCLAQPKPPPTLCTMRSELGCRDARPTWELNVTEPVAGNYYPLTAGALLRDGGTELAVLTDRAQGGWWGAHGEMALHACAVCARQEWAPCEGMGCRVVASSCDVHCHFSERFEVLRSVACTCHRWHESETREFGDHGAPSDVGGRLAWGGRGAE